MVIILLLNIPALSDHRYKLFVECNRFISTHNFTLLSAAGCKEGRLRPQEIIRVSNAPDMPLHSGQHSIHSKSKANESVNEWAGLRLHFIFLARYSRYTDNSDADAEWENVAVTLLERIRGMKAHRRVVHALAALTGFSPAVASHIVNKLPGADYSKLPHTLQRP